MFTKIFSIFAVALLLIMLPLLMQAEQIRPVAPLIDSPGNTIGSDFNGDGIHDIIIGAHRNGDCAAGLTCGSAYIFFGATNLSGTKDTGAGAEDMKILGKGVDDRLGRTVSSAGDINGDGLDDIIVGAHYNNDGGSNDEGAAYIFFGATNLSGTKDTAAAAEDVRILGKAADDRLGHRVSGAGDVNGDGFDDFIVGAQNNDDGANNAGAVYIFFGASNISGTFDMGGGVQSANVTIFGKAADDDFGKAVSGAGDVNGDGFDDIIVGALKNNDGGSDNEGAAYIFFGATDLSGTKKLGGADSADVTILGKATTDQLGTSVSSAGDVNGDGFHDFIIGADQNNDGGTNNEGAAYIFFGASDLSGTKALGGVSSADFTILGKSTSDLLGRGVSEAGDVNNDGIDDIMVDAAFNDDGGTNNEGAAYVFFGATDLSGTKALGGVSSADVTILGKTAIDTLGRGISGVGDVNGDGIADFAVGADATSSAAGTGAAYIFFGASDLSGTKDLGGVQSADVSFLGKTALDSFGVSVGGGRSSPGP